jgi:hypothetical protein
MHGTGPGTFPSPHRRLALLHDYPLDTPPASAGLRHVSAAVGNSSGVHGAFIGASRTGHAGPCGTVMPAAAAAG